MEPFRAETRRSRARAVALAQPLRAPDRAAVWGGVALAGALSAALLALVFALAGPAAAQSPAAAGVAKQSTLKAAAFPHCPAPALAGLNLRVRPAEDGTAPMLQVFVTLQNAGRVGFEGPAEGQSVALYAGERLAERMPFTTLKAGEARIVRTDLPLTPGEAVTLRAAIEFSGDGVRTARALDCQMSDNVVTRSAEALKVLAERAGF